MWWDRTPRRLVEADADGFFRHLEVAPALRPARADLFGRLVQAVESDERGVRLVVGTRAVALDRVRPGRHLPLELQLRQALRPRQHYLDRLAGGLEVVPELDDPRLRRHPLPCERAATGVAGDVAVAALVVDARRDDPAVLVGEVALLRLRDRRLV